MIVPQAVRRVIPPLLNDFIGLQKDTALVSRASASVEALPQADIDAAADFNFTPYLWPRSLFVLLTIPLARFTDWLVARERRRRAGGGGSGERPPRAAVEGVHKSFGEAEVLRGIDLAVAEHEVVCLIGASGSGKSTLLRCINLLEPIDAGRIVVGGADDHRARRRRERGPAAASGSCSRRSTCSRT